MMGRSWDMGSNEVPNGPLRIRSVKLSQVESPISFPLPEDSVMRDAKRAPCKLSQRPLRGSLTDRTWQQISKTSAMVWGMPQNISKYLMFKENMANHIFTYNVNIFHHVLESRFLAKHGHRPWHPIFDKELMAHMQCSGITSWAPGSHGTTAEGLAAANLASS